MTSESNRPSVLGPGRARQSAIYRAGALGRKPSVPTDPSSLERRAKKAMSPTAWAYVSGGAGEGRTMQHNREAFGRWRIVPRMLHGAGGVRQVIENIIAELDLTMACSAFRTSPVSQRISLCRLPEDQPDRGEAAPSTR